MVFLRTTSFARLLVLGTPQARTGLCRRPIADLPADSADGYVIGKTQGSQPKEDPFAGRSLADCPSDESTCTSRTSSLQSIGRSASDSSVCSLLEEAECECSCCRPAVADEVEERWGLDTEVPLPQRMRYVLSGYRINVRGVYRCLKSLFWMHNQTVNIWTHLLGAIYFFLFGLRLLEIVGGFDSRILTLSYNLLWRGPLSANGGIRGLGMGGFSPDGIEASSDDEDSNSGIAMVALQVAASLLCMLSSSIYHIFCCDDKHQSACFQLDLAGVSLQIFISTCAGIFYGYSCFPELRRLYLSLYLVIGLGLLSAPHLPCFKCQTDAMRVAGYLFTAALGIVPTMHLFVIIASHERRLMATYLFLMVFFYMIGIVTYQLKIPERWAPGKFDLLFHSHQWWHVFVFIASYFWTEAIAVFHAYRAHSSISCAAL